MKLIVTGATGYLGVPLVAALRARGDDIVVLTRDVANAQARLPGVRAVHAELEGGRGAWTAELAGAGAIVHLQGEPVAGKRWDARQKQIIRDSRVEATRGLVEAIAALPVGDRPAALISASGVDYYPYAHEPMDDDEVTEADPLAAEGQRVRVACLRTGIVVGPGGPIGKMATPFKLFGGGKIGHGRQWMSWISREDIVALYVAATTDARYTGPINATAPASIRNADFAKALGHALHRPSWLRVPGFALHAAVGEFADVLLHGRNVVPARLAQLGFTYQHAALPAALAAAV
jgi:hypothetical protein